MFQRRRARLILILCIITALVLVTVDFRAGEGDDGPLQRVREVVTSVFRPVQDGVVTLVRPLGDAASSVTEIFAVRRENERLRAQIETLSERHRSATDLEEENAELRSLLDIRERGELETVAARTVALGPSNFEWTITIDVGTEAGVERGMPVINGDGLVGRVFQTSDNAARVLLAIDPNFAASARIAESRETGLVDGRGGDPMLFEPIDPEAEIEVGAELVTNSYEGGTFPAGIPIGSVAEVGEASTRLTREVQIRPFVDFTRLNHVLVVVEQPVEDVPPLDEVGEGEVFEPPDVDPQPDPEGEGDVVDLGEEEGSEGEGDGDGDDDGGG